MLIRNATVLIGKDLSPGMDLRLMHGAVQETGSGLVKGLYESELDLQGDVLRPGMAVIRPGVKGQELRRLYHQGVALVITDALPAGRIHPPGPQVIVMNPLPEEVPAELQEHCIRPGSRAPLTRWSADGAFRGMIDEHTAD